MAEQVRVGSCPNDNRVMATGTAISGDQLTANESAQLMQGGRTIPVTPDGTMGIAWSSYGEYGYGLRLVHGPVLTVLSHAEFCSVTDEPPWQRSAENALSELGSTGST